MSCHLALAIGLDAMFQAVELPAGTDHLDISLDNMDGDVLMCGGWLAGTGNRRRHHCPVTVPNKLTVDVSNAVRFLII